jgi:putative ABC transport system ATP-binding protein
MSKIKVNNLSHSYQDGMKIKKVLNNISCEFETGKFYAILGESGSGKTTFLSLISGLDTIEEGDITYNDKSIKEIGYNNYRLNNVNIIFQSYNLIPYMTAIENVIVAMDIMKLKIDNKKEQALEILSKLGIDENTASRTVLKLSGGEQQRVAIARSLIGDIEFIMADEPTGNLDEKTEEKIINIFKDLVKKGKCVVVVTHSKKVAKSADVIYHIKGGDVVVEK